jgi:ketosteroid isomerase-like protein
MSRENVEVVRRCVEAWQRDDFETFLSVIHPEVEWHTALERLVEGVASVYRGHEGMREFWTTYRSELEDFKVETQELRGLGDNRVLHLCHIRWRGPASGIELESPVGIVVTIRDGKVVRSMDHLSHDEALEAAGLSE